MWTTVKFVHRRRLRPVCSLLAFSVETISSEWGSPIFCSDWLCAVTTMEMRAASPSMSRADQTGSVPSTHSCQWKHLDWRSQWTEVNGRALPCPNQWGCQKSLEIRDLSTLPQPLYAVFHWYIRPVRWPSSPWDSCKLLNSFFFLPKKEKNL